MRHDARTWAGVCLLVGAAQFLTLMMAAEALAPGYIISDRPISDLGVGATAGLFNGSIIALGLLILLGGYLLHRTQEEWLVTVPVLLTGIGAVGVGVFPETTGAPHGIAALIAFVFGNLAAILAYRLEPPPLRWISPALGILGLAALGLGLSGTYLGLGFGGMERMVAYPALLWAVAFGAFLMSATAGGSAAPPPAQGQPEEKT